MCNSDELIMKRIKERIQILQVHTGPTQIQEKNQYAELHQAVSRIVGEALLNELRDLYEYGWNARKSNCK